MTFRIIGDRIEYERRSVATFLNGLVPTFRDRVESVLETAAPDMISEQDHADALREQEKEFEDEIFRLETQLADAKAEAEKWLGELNSLDDAENPAARISEIVEEKAILAGEVQYWKKLFQQSQETIRQLQFEAKQQKSAARRKNGR
jgi:predicted RNase H-like nuclease (RuvC/YqgF family)